MSGGPEFYQTHAGRKFFEGTLPTLCRGIEKLVSVIERHNELKEIEIGLKPDTRIREIAEEFLSDSQKQD